jgi:hypothetical protein
MIEIVSAKGAFHYLETIIKGARERIVLVSPYLQVPQTIRDRLREAAQRGVPITVVARDIEREEGKKERDELLGLPGLSIYTLANLHAKCYLNERQLVITSLNLYEFSERNWEMGVMFTADEAAYTEASEEVNSIIAAAVPFIKPTPPTKPAPLATRHSPSTKVQGFCIRCAARVALKPAAPLCHDCWIIWAAFENEEYPEKFCHSCGRKEATSKARPRCKRCYSTAAKA